MATASWRTCRGRDGGCDHPSFVHISPLIVELLHFQYFSTWRPSAILDFKNFDIWSRNCHYVPNLLLCTKLVHAFVLLLDDQRRLHAHKVGIRQTSYRGAERGECRSTRMEKPQKPMRWSLTYGRVSFDKVTAQVMFFC